MIHDIFAANFFARYAREREILRNYLLQEKTAASDEGPSIKIEAECLRRIGIPLGTIHHMSPDLLTMQLRRMSNFPYRAAVLAEILLCDAEVNRAEGNIPTAVGSELQAFCVLADLVSQLEGSDQEECRARTEVLATKLHSVSNDPYLRGMIETYRAKALPVLA